MNKYVPLSKKSKKEQKKFHAMQRRTWDGFNPVTKTVPNGKAYNRKKMKQRDIQNGSYFRNETTAVFLWLQDFPNNSTVSRSSARFFLL